jgi:hypothetical protein
MAKHIDWNLVSESDVVRALDEYDQLGADGFFEVHGFAPATTYELIRGNRSYPPKALLGAAYEFATGERLASADFEGGRSGAVTVLSALGFDVRPQRS